DRVPACSCGRLRPGVGNLHLLAGVGRGEGVASVHVEHVLAGAWRRGDALQRGILVAGEVEKRGRAVIVRCDIVRVRGCRPEISDELGLVGRIEIAAAAWDGEVFGCAGDGELGLVDPDVADVGDRPLAERDHDGGFVVVLLICSAAALLSSAAFFPAVDFLRLPVSGPDHVAGQTNSAVHHGNDAPVERALDVVAEQLRVLLRVGARAEESHLKKVVAGWDGIGYRDRDDSVAAILRTENLYRPMKLSEAMMLGATLRPQARGSFYSRRFFGLFGEKTSCALGAAYEAGNIQVVG